MNSNTRQASLFQMDGIPKMTQALPMALQHVVAMIVGCVTPAIIISGVAGLETADRVILIQASLVVSALCTLLQLFPIGNREGLHLGAGLPVILGVSFAYVPSMQAIAEVSGVSAILGAQIVGGFCAILVGLTIKKIRKFFPPLIAGTVVFTIGLSLYPTAINYMAGGSGQPGYGSWQNWLVSIFTLTVVTVLNHFAKGFLKLASILIGMIAGYLFSIPFGMVSLNSVGEAGIFQVPELLHFGITFEASACVALGLLFVINSVQAIGDFSATTAGGLNREPTTQELQGAILGYGVSNIIGACLGCLPTATYSQNVGIVATTKVVNRVTLGLAALIILVAGLFPKFSALLTTIPYAVLGGATVSVFASIAMTGMKLVMTEDMNYRNTSIVGLAAALGMGVSQASASLSAFPEWVTTIFGKSPVVIATLVAIFLNVTLPKEKEKVARDT
ncbi:MAG TPA: purine permease [Candidatus Enterocloster excrementipullorum]|uniref:Purine permease n=1 Tax=Candidatus Enterocloster excrementipullorum TaxID=2838559 RepID=A0A9D2MZC7_9FIRM|nr:purine permease [Candidatus Enterocloster excrementipullorum]